MKMKKKLKKDLLKVMLGLSEYFLPSLSALPFMSCFYIPWHLLPCSPFALPN